MVTVASRRYSIIDIQFDDVFLASSIPERKAFCHFSANLSSLDHPSPRPAPISTNMTHITCTLFIMADFLGGECQFC